MEIRMEGVWKSFGDKTVLRDVSMAFPPGSVTCLMGPSGCGKTTLLRIVMGLVKPDRGRVSGVPEGISVLFQEDRLCQGFSPVANVRLVTGRSVPEEEIRELLGRLGLEDSLDLPARELSGGMSRRAALCRALLASGELLILDEPFKGLDPETRERAAGLVREYARGRTLLFVTHDSREAALLGGTVRRLDGFPERP